MPLSHKDNELLCRVVNGAPMGEFLRSSYWFPACLSQQLVPDGAPLRVMLLGRKYVAFRSTDGRVGFFPEACPHRGTSLALGRNEDNAIRCIYHGWKFGVDGKVVEVPTQHAHHEEFCRRVPLKAYAVREAGRMVWVWIGEGEPAKFPNFVFNMLPHEQVYPIRQIVDFNWIQGIEGQVDSAHVPILHQDFVKTTTDHTGAAGKNLAPVYEIDDYGVGFHAAAIRDIGNEQRYIRVTNFVAPWYCFIPYAEGVVEIHVPLDDVTTALYIVRWNPNGIPSKDHLTPADDPANWPPYLSGGEENRWGQDREIMRYGSFTGYPRNAIQEDFAVAASQGDLASREVEFLNQADMAVMQMRRYLLGAVSEHQQGKIPKAALHEAVDYSKLRAVGITISKSEDWRNFV